MTIMNPIIIESKDYIDLNLPETIYKYRTWTNPFHLSILTKRLLFMASPRSFKDPFDCRIPIRLDLLTEKDIFEKCLYQSKKDHESWNRNRHRKYATECNKKSPIKDKDFIKEWQTNYFDDFFNHFGVLSLTANPSNELMWESYSDNHQGFCVGFDTIKLFKHLGGGGKVIYYDELPIIYPTPKHSYEQQHMLLVFSKLHQFEYEQEYRTHKFYQNTPTNEERTIQISPESFKKLIIGKRMPEIIKEELLISIPDELDHIILLDEK